MKNLVLFFIITTLLISCSAKRQIEKTIYSGNYDQAIYSAIEKLKKTKNKKHKYDYALMLQDAYHKATKRDIKTISQLEKSNNPEYYIQIFEKYLDLDDRQETIKPFLPLKVNGKTIKFTLNDYNDEINTYRNLTSEYLYDNALSLLSSDNKLDVRDAFDTFEYIENINPNYKNTRALMQQAHRKGIEHVLVSIHNKTHLIIPEQLEDFLLDFNTYGLDMFWTNYHSTQEPSITYDYSMDLELKHIAISPEHIKEKEELRQKRIKDGWEYQLDSNGNVMKDSLGNDIKVDKFINAKARVFNISQYKNVEIYADVIFYDLKNNQILQQFPIQSGFAFENHYATYKGDKRALTKDDKKLIRNEQLPFPSDSQMVLDTGEDIKLQLKSILKKHPLRSDIQTSSK